RLVEAGDAVERRCLSCPVGADDGDDLLGVRREGETVDGLDTTEGDLQVLNLEYRVHRLSPFLIASLSSLARVRSASDACGGHSPCGRNTMTTTSSTPNMR